MAEIVPFPASSREVFLDTRGGHRALRVSWHGDAGVVVLSLWRGGTCTGSFRMPASDVPALLRSLSEAASATGHGHVDRTG
jgi:hypothetical protein